MVDRPHLRGLGPLSVVKELDDGGQLADELVGQLHGDDFGGGVDVEVKEVAARGGPREVLVHGSALRIVTILLVPVRCALRHVVVVGLLLCLLFLSLLLLLLLLLLHLLPVLVELDPVHADGAVAAPEFACGRIPELVGRLRLPVVQLGVFDGERHEMVVFRLREGGAPLALGLDGRGVQQRVYGISGRLLRHRGTG